MMKKLFFLSFLYACFVGIVQADEQKKIELNNTDHLKETLEIPDYKGRALCNIIVSLDASSDADKASVTVNVDNTGETYTIILFNRAYNVKNLKKLSPSITYDKSFPGSKGNPIIDYNPDIINGTINITPSHNVEVLKLVKPADDVIVCRLPLYIAKVKDKNFIDKIITKSDKLVLFEKIVIELQINVKLKPDEEFVSIEDEYNNITSGVSRETFCTNRYHRGTKATTLVNAYKKRASSLKKRIDKYITDKHYSRSSSRYQKLKDMELQLDDLNFKSVSSCPRDHKSESCKYGSMSYESIYKRLENYYIDIRNGDKSKSKVLDDVNGISKCVNHHNHLSGDESLKSRINTYISEIKSM